MCHLTITKIQTEVLDIQFGDLFITSCLSAIRGVGDPISLASACGNCALPLKLPSSLHKNLVSGSNFIYVSSFHVADVIWISLVPLLRLCVPLWAKHLRGHLMSTVYWHLGIHMLTSNVIWLTQSHSCLWLVATNYRTYHGSCCVIAAII